MSDLKLLYPKTLDRRDVWNAKLLHWCKFDGKYEMPAIPVCNVVPHKLTAFTEAKTSNGDGSFLHFYMDAYRYERIWRNPMPYLPRVQAYAGAIAPDFSVYREMPLVQQMFNIYRSRVIGYWWSRNGVVVVPNARWGDERTYEFCFDGLPKNSVVAVGTHGCVKHIDDRRHFFNGFMVMLERIQPKAIIIYGSASDKIIPPLFVCKVKIIRFESDFSRLHKKEAA
jgi:hypothetical protein